MEKMDDDFRKKVNISEDSMDDDPNPNPRNSNKKKIASLLRTFLDVQQRRAQTYATLRRGFADYMISGGESAYHQLCTHITTEFTTCSKQVIELESMFSNTEYSRNDLAQLLRAIQEQEKQKLNLTATIQVLKKAGRPSERLVGHENCRFKKAMEHECVHVREITEASGTEDAEADAEFDNALKEAIQGVQDAVTTINEHLEEVRYEIAALETE